MGIARVGAATSGQRRLGERARTYMRARALYECARMGACVCIESHWQISKVLAGRADLFACFQAIFFSCCPPVLPRFAFSVTKSPQVVLAQNLKNDRFVPKQPDRSGGICAVGGKTPGLGH